MSTLISFFAASMQERLLQWASNNDRLHGRTLDDRPPKPLDPSWSDDEVLKYLLTEAASLVSDGQTIPSPEPKAKKRK